MAKWQRSFFQPVLPLGEDGRRVTGSKEHIALSRMAAGEGMVLLKNEKNTLPIRKGTKVALFGKGTVDYVKGGGGSGDVTVEYIRNLYEGMKIKEDEGKVEVFDKLAKYYEEDIQKQYADGAVPGMTVEPELPDELLNEAREYTDTAVITICRFSGEGWDRKCEAAQEEAYARIRRKQADKKVSKSKKKWIPPQLENLVMESSSPRSGHMTGEHMLNYFGIIGGEFGNYENDADRQVSLDYAFDSFCDIAEALGIDYKTTSLPKLSRGGLSIAFGARGRGAAVAHYEFLREVINVTKIRGAGSLGHEWGHALDHMIGQLYECPELATEARGYNMPATIKKILQDIKYDDHGNLSKYYSDSMKFNSTYNKMGHGYWTSNCELFARAFACYLADKLQEKGYRNDYLNGLANAYVIKNDESEKKCYAYPRGEERIRINHAIDELIADLKKSGIFTPAGNKKHSSEIFYTYSKDGQMSFC